MLTSKKCKQNLKAYDFLKLYSPQDAFQLITEKLIKAKFDETVETHIRLGVDSKQADQQVRGIVVLPHGTGKKTRILVLAKNEKADEAIAAGADYVGAEDIIYKIQNENWFDFDIIVATPDIMGQIGRIGKILGPKGLMPNPKSGTVTLEVAKAISDIKSGKVEYKLDKTNIVHSVIGKVSFGAVKISENFFTLLGAINKSKPPKSKGQYLKSIAVCTTMGPGIKINPLKIEE